MTLIQISTSEIYSELLIKSKDEFLVTNSNYKNASKIHFEAFFVFGTIKPY